MAKLVDFMPELENRRTFGFFDDFDWFISPHRWTKVVTDVVSTVGIAVADGAGGILTMSPEDATDNDEVYLKTTTEIFKFADNKPGVWEARIQVAEANTNALNVFFGVKDAIAADTLLDNGGGPAASYSGALFFKEDGQTVWSVETSIAGTQTTTQLTAANSLDKVAHTAGSAAYQTLRISFVPYSSGRDKADVNFWIDGVLVAKHAFTYTNATEMQVGAGVKNGSTTAETAYVDYIAAYQLR